MELNTRREISYLQAIMCTLPNFIKTNDDVSDDFSKSSDHFPRILRMLSEGHTNVSEDFTKISKDLRRFPKLFEGFRGRSENVCKHQQM